MMENTIQKIKSVKTNVCSYWKPLHVFPSTLTNPPAKNIALMTSLLVFGISAWSSLLQYSDNSVCQQALSDDFTLSVLPTSGEDASKSSQQNLILSAIFGTCISVSQPSNALCCRESGLLWSWESANEHTCTFLMLKYIGRKQSWQGLQLAHHTMLWIHF